MDPMRKEVLILTNKGLLLGSLGVVCPLEVVQLARVFQKNAAEPLEDDHNSYKKKR